MGYLVAGSAALVICRGALGTLFPAASAALYRDDHMHALTRNQTWRDMARQRAASGRSVAGDNDSTNASSDYARAVCRQFGLVFSGR